MNRAVPYAALGLKEIYKPVQKWLDAADALLRKELNSEYPFLHRLNRSSINRRGKRIRPALVLFSSGAAGRIRAKASVRLAAAVELIHNATLIHDDIIDNASLRRGKKTVNACWGRNTAILFGDYVYSVSSRLLSTVYVPGVLEYLACVTNAICEGEMKQLRMTFRKNMGEKTYMDIIEKKTAGFMAASCKIGAMAAGADKKTVSALESFGRAFGMAFQIIDDCRDVTGSEKEEGKTLGTDIKEGKCTLPLLYKNRFGSEGAVKKAFGKAALFIEEAKDCLNNIRPSVYKNGMVNLADFLTARFSV